jgi:CheY-like chemotaxis protein
MIPRVLIVDDVPDVRETIAATFEDLGFEVLQAGNGREALRVLSGNKGIVLLFTDILMPQMDGQQLAAAALKLQPDLKVIFTSGYTGKPWIASPFIAKPFRRDRLAEIVAQTLAIG